MIRKEVEKLRGMVLTPEELEGVILPLVATTKEKESELDALWAKVEEAKKLYEKAMADILTAQKEYLIKLEEYNTKKMELFREGK